MKIVQQITRRKELSAQWIPKPLKGFYLYFVLKSAYEIKNGSPITKRKKLPAHWIAKPFKGFSKS